MSEKSTVIHISSGTIWRGILIIALAWAAFLLRDLILILLASVVIASAIEPATRWFGHYRIPRIPSVIAVYVAVIIVIAGIFYLLIPSLLSEVSNLPEFITARIFDFSSLDMPATSDVATKTGENIVNNISNILPAGELFKNINTLIGVPAGAFHAASAIFGGFFQMILIIVISFYLSVQERGIENFLRIVIPAREEDYAVDLWRRTQTKIGKWMQGQLILALLVGVLVYLGLTVLGVKYALSLALFAALAELIPIFGPIIAAVPAVILGFLDSVTLGLMVFGLYVIIQQFENHLIYPLVVRKVVGVPPLLVIIALLVGGQLAGFLGILLAVPLAAVVLEFTDDVQKKKHVSRGVASV